MVILDHTDEYRMIANNGFVWIEYADGTEEVLDDDEADEAWEAFNVSASVPKAPRR